MLCAHCYATQSPLLLWLCVLDEMKKQHEQLQQKYARLQQSEVKHCNIVLHILPPRVHVPPVQILITQSFPCMWWHLPESISLDDTSCSRQCIVNRKNCRFLSDLRNSYQYTVGNITKHNVIYILCKLPVLLSLQCYATSMSTSVVILWTGWNEGQV